LTLNFDEINVIFLSECLLEINFVENLNARESKSIFDVVGTTYSYAMLVTIKIAGIKTGL
jgi:hypothetical protein